jgi:hypothetical protein
VVTFRVRAERNPGNVSIEKKVLADGSNKYLARYRTSDGRRTSRQFRLKRDAQAWLDEQAASWRSGTWLDPSSARLTVADWIETWEAEYSAGLRSSTRARYEGVFRVYVIPRFGHVALGRLDTALLQSWVAELGQADLQPASISKIVHSFGRVLGIGACIGRSIGEQLHRRALEQS